MRRMETAQPQRYLPADDDTSNLEDFHLPDKEMVEDGPPPTPLQIAQQELHHAQRTRNARRQELADDRWEAETKEKELELADRRLNRIRADVDDLQSQCAAAEKEYVDAVATEKKEAELQQVFWELESKYDSIEKEVDALNAHRDTLKQEKSLWEADLQGGQEIKQAAAQMTKMVLVERDGAPLTRLERLQRDIDNLTNNRLPAINAQKRDVEADLHGLRLEVHRAECEYYERYKAKLTAAGVVDWQPRIFDVIGDDWGEDMLKQQRGLVSAETRELRDQKQKISDEIAEAEDTYDTLKHEWETRGVEGAKPMGPKLIHAESVRPLERLRDYEGRWVERAWTAFEVTQKVRSALKKARAKYNNASAQVAIASWRLETLNGVIDALRNAHRKRNIFAGNDEEDMMKRLDGDIARMYGEACSWKKDIDQVKQVYKDYERKNPGHYEYDVCRMLGEVNGREGFAASNTLAFREDGRLAWTTKQ